MFIIILIILIIIVSLLSYIFRFIQHKYATYERNSLLSSCVENMDSVSEIKHFLLIVNPYGGGGIGCYMRDFICTILDQYECTYEVLMTESRLHAMKYFESLPLKTLCQYDVIATIGGDGLVYEVVNGICARRDDFVSNAHLLVVPSGSNNGVATSILPSFRHDSIWKRAFQAIHLALSSQGEPRATDLIKIERGDSERAVYGLISVSYGTIADVDEDAETTFRRCGPALSILCSAGVHLFRLRNVEVELEFHAVNVTDGSVDDEPTVVKGYIRSVGIFNIAFCGADLLTAPNVKLDDGLLEIQLWRTASRKDLLSAFMQLDSGGHITSDAIEVFRTCELTLKPLSDPSRPIFMDGEHVESNEKLKISCVSRAIQIYRPVATQIS